ncbi:MAG TPA: hypothetical protein VFK03_00875 [Candidatus Saccharimonadales bacterium]|nr:hypothetical protein [Candidatus Saccharimonadales bacterium]
MIDDYKFDAVRQAVKPLSILLDASTPRLGDVTICEVPTAASHVRRLGYDHAKLLAKTLAWRRHLRYRPLLKRTGQQTQHFSGRQARLAQAAKLFTARQSISGPVLLIDDIVTTGASLQAATKVLYGAGASEVYSSVLVRQPLD